MPSLPVPVRPVPSSGDRPVLDSCYLELVFLRFGPFLLGSYEEEGYEADDEASCETPESDDDGDGRAG